MPRWTRAEERYIIEAAGNESLRDMADRLGRSYPSVRSHVHRMREKGLISCDTRIFGEDTYISDLTECIECGEPRSTCDGDGVCKVCRDRKILDAHIKRMYRSYANLPQELKEKTNGSFELRRVDALMKTSLERPQKPCTDGLEPFWAARAMDDWHRANEAYQLRRLKLDIDAAKQRRSKWNRKAAKWRAGQKEAKR